MSAGGDAKGQATPRLMDQLHHRRIRFRGIIKFSSETGMFLRSPNHNVKLQPSTFIFRRRIMMNWLNEPVSNGSIILFLLIAELVRTGLDHLKSRAIIRDVAEGSIRMIDDEEQLR